MDNEEIIELFFSKYNEQAFNEKILEDIDYEIPHNLVLNYVRSVIQVPFNEYVKYVIKYTEDEFDPIEIEGIPTFYNLVDCRERMIDLMLMEDNRGLKLMEIGSYIKTHSISMNPGYTVVGRKSVQVAETLGIVYEYYNHWYLNCVAYVFDELSRQELQAFYARAILRNGFVKMLLVLCLQGRVSIYDFLFDPYQEVNISTMRSIEFWYSTLHRAICKPYHLHEIEELEELHEREEKKAMSAVRGDLWSRKTDFDISSYVDEVCVAEVDLNDPLAYEPKDSMGNPMVLVEMPDGRWAKSYAYSAYFREVPSMVDNDGYYRTGSLPDFVREIALLLRDRTSVSSKRNKEKMDALVKKQLHGLYERRMREYQGFENEDPTENESAPKRRQERIERETIALVQKSLDELKHEEECEANIRELAEIKEHEQREQEENAITLTKQKHPSRVKREKRESVYTRAKLYLQKGGCFLTGQYQQTTTQYRSNYEELNSVRETEYNIYGNAEKLSTQQRTTVVTKASTKQSESQIRLSPTSLLKLSQLFKNVSTSYKFFWMLALLDVAESPNFNGKLVMRAVTVRMVANAWSVLAHGIDFPKLDKLPSVIAEAQKHNINTSTKQGIFRGVYAIQDANFHRLMDQLEANVPYRFLSPWIPYFSDQQVVRDSNDQTKMAPYSIKKQGRASEIHIKDEWKDYFRTDASTLRRMTYTALAKYLHSCNPSKTEDEIVVVLQKLHN